MEYNVGDKVVVKNDLEHKTRYGEEIYFRDMGNLGEAVEISEVEGNCYILKEGKDPIFKWGWTDEMIDHEATSKLEER